MKLVLGLVVLANVNAFAFDFTEKNPEKTDISINTMVEHGCQTSGYFNVDVCYENVNKCYNKAQWPKTVDVHYKLSVINDCLSKFIR